MTLDRLCATASYTVLAVMAGLAGAAALVQFVNIVRAYAGVLSASMGGF